MNKAFILTGGNIGDRKGLLLQAVDLLEKKVGFVKAASSLYETAAWGKEDQPPFLNQVLMIETLLDPTQLLSVILSIEKDMGRERAEKMGPRIIDIDILFYENIILNSPDLTLPHPQIHLRRFVLTPLNEIAPDFLHPVLEKRIKDLLLECPDPLAVRKLEDEAA